MLAASGRLAEGSSQKRRQLFMKVWARPGWRRSERERDRRSADSPLEETGFEPLVPR